MHIFQPAMQIFLSAMHVFLPAMHKQSWFAVDLLQVFANEVDHLEHSSGTVRRQEVRVHPGGVTQVGHGVGHLG